MKKLVSIHVALSYVSKVELTCMKHQIKEKKSLMEKGKYEQNSNTLHDLDESRLQISGEPSKLSQQMSLQMYSTRGIFCIAFISSACRSLSVPNVTFSVGLLRFRVIEPLCYLLMKGKLLQNTNSVMTSAFFQKSSVQIFFHKPF